MSVTTEVAMANIKRPPLYRVSLTQAAILLPLCLLLWWQVDRITAYSALLGGVICLVPNAYFASYAFRYMGARAAHQIAQAFYWGETGKFLLTFVGFGLAFLLVRPLDVLTLFLSYFAMVVVQWIVSARLIAR